MLTINVTDRGHIYQFEFPASLTFGEIRSTICRQLSLDPFDVRLALDGNYAIEPPAFVILYANKNNDLLVTRRGEYLEEHRSMLYTLVMAGRKDEIIEHLEWCRDYLSIIFQEYYGLTLWVAAMKYRKVELLSLFAKYDSDGVDCVTEVGKTALIAAIEELFIPGIIELIRLGANVNTPNGLPLLTAIPTGNRRIVGVLLEAGASIYVRNAYSGLAADALPDCIARRDVAHMLMRDSGSYLGLLPMDLWCWYLDPYLYNALKYKK